MPVRRVLIVDGDEAERRKLSALLGELASNEGLKLALREASDGGEALDVAREHEPELVLMEILLEGPHGLQVMRQLRRDKEKDQPPAVLLITEMGAEIDRYWSLRSGAAGFIKKPWQEDELKERLLRYLGPQAAKKDS